MNRLLSMLCTYGRSMISVCLFSALVSLNACAPIHSPMRQEVFQVKSRFLLTFDDGPDANPLVNSTARILEHLVNNSVQQNVKAVFFVQTRNLDGGGSVYGRSILHREYAEGHILALHSGSARGHVSHIFMSARELHQSLANGVADIRGITGQRVLLVRPPYWWFNTGTIAQYADFGLHMMLSDVKAYDGVNWGTRVFRRRNLSMQLARVRERFDRNQLPVVDGCIPIVVTFHDTNDFTADHLDEYLRILVEESGRVGLPMDEKPFYDDSTEIMIAALHRAVPPLRLELNSRTAVRTD
jgi:peptidoglycan/xylan/chitin deacetylase (PgdA/CDA1 family)